MRVTQLLTMVCRQANVAVRLMGLYVRSDLTTTVLVTGLSAAAALAGLSVSTGAVTVAHGATVMAAAHGLDTGLQTQLLRTQAGLDYHHHLWAAIHHATPTNSKQMGNWPSADLDPLTATDLEELMTFAADVFEFLHQESALFMCTFGESYTWGCVGGVLTMAYKLFRVLSSRRFK